MLLLAHDLTVTYRRSRAEFRALDSVSFSLAQGDTLCFVGESGSGKTTIARAIPRLLPSAAKLSGRIHLLGKAVKDLTARELCELRRTKISFIFQDAVGSLVPGVRIGAQVTRVVAYRMRIDNRFEARKRARNLLGLVGLVDLDRIWDAYPSELSGGMCQRVMIAMALSIEPALVIADEPISALDAVSQKHIIDLLFELQRQSGFSMLYVTHDLRVASRFDSIGVLRGGRLIEMSSAEGLLESPKAAYTQDLLAAAKDLSVS